MTDATREWILGLFEKTIDSGLKFMRKNLKEGDPHGGHQPRHLSDVPVQIAGAAQPRGELGDDATKTLHPKLAKVFVFSFVWSIGGNIDSEYHDQFDEWAREHLTVIEELGNLPNKNTLYDYVVITDSPEQPKGQFAPWDGFVQKFNYSSEVPYFELLVPNVDTTRFSFLLERCLEVDKSLLLTGGTGVGKSVIITDYLARSAEPKDLIAHRPQLLRADQRVRHPGDHRVQA